MGHVADAGQGLQRERAAASAMSNAIDTQKDLAYSQAPPNTHTHTHTHTHTNKNQKVKERGSLELVEFLMCM